MLSMINSLDKIRVKCVLLVVILLQCYSSWYQTVLLENR